MNRAVARSVQTRPAPPKISLQRTREENAQETAQDYVEMIAELIATAGEARVTDLARRLGVTHVTVNRTIQRLRRDGLVTALPYRSVFLTDAGRQLSEESRRRHEIVSAFLKSLGVPDTVAHADAEGMEHHVSKETLAAFVKHLARHGRAGRRDR
ncbi:MAG: manganese-binding transcriptional regulator MntR [Opitutaceae bacterium]|jgi:DtxR family manganese transport transcriptional regulator